MKHSLIINLKGGLGNQLFQVAHGISLSKKYNLIPLINTYFFYKEKTKRDMNINLLFPEIENVNYYLNPLKLLLPSFSNNNFIIKEKEFYIYNKIQNLDLKKNIHLYGYWQSYLYFEEHSRYILSRINSYFSNIYLSHNVNPQYLAIHIRKSDYLSDKNLKIYINLNKYFNDAVEKALVEKRISKIIIFTDDKQWCIDNLAEFLNLLGIKFIFSNLSDPLENLYYMSSFENLIMSNSSYSWWAGWLISNNKKNSLVITPSKWFVDEDHNQNISMRHLESWIKI